MKGLGMGVHIPVEVEVCTDQARQVPAISALLHHAACAFRPLSDCNTLLPVASASPEEKKQNTVRQTFQPKEFKFSIIATNIFFCLLFWQ